MNNPLPFFNWSLRKALESEPDSIVRARIRIIFTVLLFSLLKAVVVIIFGSAAGQTSHVIRGVIVFCIYIGLVKILLHKPTRIIQVSHVMIVIGILVIWSNVFVYTHKINLLTVQFMFMLMLSSFYILGRGLGIAYSIIGVLPAAIYIVSKGKIDLSYVYAGQELASPGYELIVLLNFVSIITSHYLFFDALRVHIIEKERLNQQLQVAIAEANKLAESRANFLSTMSHELRTPLNSVVGITELLLADKPEERQKENLNLLQFSAIDLLSLINNVLDFNKMNSDRQALEMAPFNLGEFIQNISSVLRVKAMSKGLELVTDIDKELEGIIIVSDPTRLSQVMYNLIGNAIKFTEEGSITIKLSITERTEQNVNILFSITDTGIGIHSDNHETVFELFTQAEAHIMHKYGGTGLGLAIVKKVLALFGSTIKLESSSGNGSMFSFAISFALSAAQGERKETAAINGANFSHLKVLVAEDNDIVRLVLKKQLGVMNIHAVVVQNGKEAYEACVDQHFHGILMDLQMPEMDGYEAIKLIRALPDTAKANMYIVAFTASITEQEKILESGFNTFLYKPINIGELQSKLAEMALHHRVLLS